MPTASSEPDVIVQSFAKLLSELKARNHRVLQDMLTETSITRDSITSSNMELSELKRHSVGVAKQMQDQLADLRGKLSSAFEEITELVTKKGESDQEMMQEVHNLQLNVESKTTELESLKKSYSQAHAQLQTSLIQIQNHVQVTMGEVHAARVASARVHSDAQQRFQVIDAGIRSVEDELNASTAEHRHQMQQLQDELGRLREGLNAVATDFTDHRRVLGTSQNKLQSQVWGLDNSQKQRQTDVMRTYSYQPPSPDVPVEAAVASAPYRPAGSSLIVTGASPRRPVALQQPISVPSPILMPIADTRNSIIMGHAPPPREMMPGRGF